MRCEQRNARARHAFAIREVIISATLGAGSVRTAIPDRTIGDLPRALAVLESVARSPQPTRSRACAAAVYDISRSDVACADDARCSGTVLGGDGL